MYMESWGSYPSIFNLGNKAIRDLLKGPVIVEEKVDGSQFSFGAFSSFNLDTCGVELLLKVRSKGAEMIPEAPEGMFKLAVATATKLLHQLRPGWTYRGEYLAKPKHNALAYDRVPVGNIIIFDINTGDQEFLGYEEKRKEAERLGLECVPTLHVGMVERIEDFRKFLDTTSVLGGQKIEGVVIKPLNYDLYGRDRRVLMGKFVSEAFREIHSHAWKNANPTGKDIIAVIGDTYANPARWQKAVQHLRESGLIEDSPKDIGLLIKEVPADVLKECEDEIKSALMSWAWPNIRRIITRGVPEWYKNQLLKRQFEV